MKYRFAWAGGPPAHVLTNGNTPAMEYRAIACSILLCLFCLSPATDAAESKGLTQPQGEAVCPDSVEKKWGIHPLSIRLSAGGYMLDFRYHVIDADKAAPLFSLQIKPYLIDQASGKQFFVPETRQKVGSLRQTRKPYPDRNYFIIFGNPGSYIKKGSPVTVVIGDLTLKDLVVQ